MTVGPPRGSHFSRRRGFSPAAPPRGSRRFNCRSNYYTTVLPFARIFSIYCAVTHTLPQDPGHLNSSSASPAQRWPLKSANLFPQRGHGKMISRPFVITTQTSLTRLHSISVICLAFPSPQTRTPPPAARRPCLRRKARSLPEQPPGRSPAAAKAARSRWPSTP